MIAIAQNKLIFNHMVELPHCECVFCSAQEEQTGRSRIFLVFKNRNKVYTRNGIKGNWEEIPSQVEREMIWEAFQNAILERKIPSFVASDPDFAIA